MKRLSLIHWLGVATSASILALLMFNDNGPFPVFKSKLVEAPGARPAVASQALEAAAAGRDARSEATHPQAEDIVVFRDSSIACLTMGDLHQAVSSGLRGEATKLSAMVMDRGNPDAPCWMVEPTQRVKVLSASYEPGAFAGLLEIVGEHTKSAHGAWVLSQGAEIVVRASRER